MLYHRDPLACLQNILEDPLISDHIRFKPLQIFDTAQKVMRIYGDWLSGNEAWSMQVSHHIT